MRSKLERVWKGLALASALIGASGCVTVAEFRKLERRVASAERGSGGDSRQARADFAAQLDALQSQLDALRGRVDLVEKSSADALKDARKAREELAARSAAAGAARDAEPSQPEAPLSEEVKAYRAAYAAWRENDSERCIDLFRKFLQTHPASPYADDAAFWMADCHFKQGDFKNAVLRFDDVVRNYPTGNKAPDALFRQGESLMQLGPGFHEAAKRAFERVLKEYPDSARAEDARRRLAVVGAG